MTKSIHSSGAHASGSRAPILVVEDDASTRAALCDILKLEGYKVAGVRDGIEALDYVHHNALPCLIILDLMMPRMDGWRFRAEQKKDPALAKCPVVVVSASIRERFIDADYVMQKPVDLDGLLSAVAEYC
jgi:CheY-like chemotaxis protein